MQSISPAPDCAGVVRLFAWEKRPVVVEPHEVGKRPADIDRDNDHCGFCNLRRQ